MILYIFDIENTYDTLAEEPDRLGHTLVYFKFFYERI